MPHFDPEKVIETALAEKKTILFGVPTMYNRLIQVASKNPPNNSSLEFCVSGGSSLPVEFLHRFEKFFNTKIYEGYGLIEEVMYQIPEILEVAVFGIPHEDFGEEVAAVVVLQEGVQIEPDEIREFVKQRVAPYKYPRNIQIAPDARPKSGTG